jgi:hypothetical protein
MLSAFGRRFARCFPLRRAHRMTLEWAACRLSSVIAPGAGSAPELVFEGEQTESPQVSDVLGQRFPSYDDMLDGSLINIRRSRARPRDVSASVSPGL